MDSVSSFLKLLLLSLLLLLSILNIYFEYVGCA